jgi:glutamate-ammonia-ligase adenylyltransferase
MLSLSNLASGLLLVAFNKAYNSLRCFHGDPLNQINNTCNYLIIGLGKLGGYEMNLGSDLDLIFLYEGGGLTSGTKKITNQEFFSKVIQKTISYLSTTTTQGFLYKIDLRLRPSGASGTLITSLNSFKSYHEKGGMLWEKQILLKSRIINEGSSLSHEFNNIKEMLISTKPLQKKEILEIYNMRHRIETEKIKNFHVYDIKSGYGGLIDIEFIVQLLQMCSTSKSQQLKTTNTFKLINDLKHYNILKDRDYNILEKSYTFYRTIESLIRAYNNSYSSVLPKNKELLNKIASFYGYKKDGDKKIIDDYINIRKATRACFSRIFNEHLSQTD